MKKLLILITFLTGSFQLFAQDEMRAEREKKIQALYVAFITQELRLTEDEAQKFWPVHSQFDQEVRSVGMNAPELERQQNVLNVKKKYQERFIKILGAQRTDDFYRKDAEFRKRLVERLRKMKEGGGQRPFRRNGPPPQ